MLCGTVRQDAPRLWSRASWHQRASAGLGWPAPPASSKPLHPQRLPHHAVWQADRGQCMCQDVSGRMPAWRTMRCWPVLHGQVQRGSRRTRILMLGAWQRRHRFVAGERRPGGCCRGSAGGSAGVSWTPHFHPHACRVFDARCWPGRCGQDLRTWGERPGSVRVPSLEPLLLPTPCAAALTAATLQPAHTSCAHPPTGRGLTLDAGQRAVTAGGDSSFSAPSCVGRRYAALVP